jgi:hypothetical protein
VDYDGKEAVINAGRNAGVKPGDPNQPARGDIVSVAR